MTRLRIRSRQRGRTTGRSVARRSLTEEAIVDDEDTFRNARLWDYRPLGDAFDQLQAIRPYYDFTDVDTDRYTIDGAQRQVMLSARELDPSATSARRLGQRAHQLHARHRHGDGAGQRGRRPRASRACSSATCRRCRAQERPRSRSRGSTSASGRAATSSSGRQARRVRLPDRIVRRVGHLDALDRRQRDQPRHDADAGAVRAALPRPQPAHQRPGHEREPAAVRPRDRASECRRSRRSCATTRTRTSSSTRRPAASSTSRTRTPMSDRFPHANWFDPARARRPPNLGGGAFNYIRNSVKITIDAYDGTTTFYVADPSDPIVRTYAERLPEALPAAGASCPRAFRRTSASRRSSSTSRPGCSGDTTSPSPQHVLPQRRPVDGARGPDDRADPPVRGLLRGHADARRARGRVPAPPADGPARAGRT